MGEEFAHLPIAYCLFRRNGCPDIQVQYVNYVAEKARNSFSKVKDATLSVLSSAEITLPGSTVRYEKSRKTTESDSERNRKFAGSMAFWRNNSDDTSMQPSVRGASQARTYFVCWRADLTT
jgi:hypothetical protein